MSYNQLTPAEAERLAILAEECAEVIQAVGKILRHGYDSHHPDRPSVTNREELAVEIGHVEWASGLMIRAGDIEVLTVHNSSFRKMESAKPYLHHQS